MATKAAPDLAIFRRVLNDIVLIGSPFRELGVFIQDPRIFTDVGKQIGLKRAKLSLTERLQNSRAALPGGERGSNRYRQSHVK